MDTPERDTLKRLIVLLTHVRSGAIAIAHYDRLSVRREVTARLRRELPQRVHEIHLSRGDRNPIDLIRKLRPEPGDVICLFDLEQAFPDALGYLDLQRETLTELEVSILCWATEYEHRELARRAPNFYAYRRGVFDFTTNQELQPRDSPFVGREQAVRDVTALLRAGGCVILTGLGGVGKTTLAAWATRRTNAHFVGGAVWVDCEANRLIDDLLLSVAIGLLGDMASQSRPTERRQRLTDAMRERPCLVVLDNFETLADDADALRWLSTVEAPSAALLVSRQRIPYLRARTFALAELQQDEAVKLFSQRAREAGWDGEGTDIVPRLCFHVGNLPLAIELLAPQAAELPLAILEARVQASLDTMAAPDAPLLAQRHRSIAACFRISFDRLSEDARSLITRLCIPPDGVPADLMVCLTAIEAWQTPAAECVRHSLLRLDGGRYRIHPLLRRFGLDMLENANVWQWHFVQCYRDLMKENSEINDPTKLAILDREWRNAVAAARDAKKIHKWGAVIALSADLSSFLALRGLWGEREDLNRKAICAARQVGDRRLEGGSLGNLGNVLAMQGRLSEAEAAFENALGIQRQQADRRAEAGTLTNLGNVYESQGRWEEAERMYLASLELKKQLGDHPGAGSTLNNLGIVYENLERWAEAERAYLDGLEIKRASGDQLGAARLLNNLGNLYRRLERWSEAEPLLKESLAIEQASGNDLGASGTLLNLAILRRAQNDATGGAEYARKALALVEETSAIEAEAARALLAALERQN